MSDDQSRLADPRYGKYRGKVVESLDPLELGRLQVAVASAPGLGYIWAMPCVPYAGPEVGFYFIPPIGANVWVEFEGGDVNYPIWVGCFWSEGEKPAEAVDPLIKVIRTQTATITINDTPEVGGVTIEAAADVSISAGGAAEVTAGADLNLSAGGAAELYSGGDT